MSFHHAHAAFGPHGAPRDKDASADAAARLLLELGWWTHALRTARAACPYPYELL